MEELMTVKELCKLLKVSKAWPCRAIKNGLIPHYRLGTLVRFRPDDVEAYIEKCRREGKTEKLPERKTKKVRGDKEKIESPEPKHIPENETHSQERPHVGGVCRRCLKRTDGKIDYLTNGLCRSCNHTR
jgi:excisionase family DNA binding protein